MQVELSKFERDWLMVAIARMMKYPDKSGYHDDYYSIHGKLSEHENSEGKKIIDLTKRDCKALRDAMKTIMFVVRFMLPND